jgi:hypothetical protein
MISAFQSADGVAWTPVGTVTVPGLPQAVEVGPFVASPPATLVQRQFGSIKLGQYPTYTRAVFERPTLEPVGTPGAGSGEPRDGWQDDEVSDATNQPGPSPAPNLPEGKKQPPGPPAAVWAGNRLTLVGIGDIAPRTVPQDVIKQGLTGVYVGLMAIDRTGDRQDGGGYRQQPADARASGSLGGVDGLRHGGVSSKSSSSVDVFEDSWSRFDAGRSRVAPGERGDRGSPTAPWDDGSRGHGGRRAPRPPTA